MVAPFFDPNASHVAINVNGAFSTNAVVLPYNLDDASAVHHAWVDYDGGTDVLGLRGTTVGCAGDAVAVRIRVRTRTEVQRPGEDLLT